MAPSRLRFLLPPSLGSKEARERAEGLDVFFGQALGLEAEVRVASSYTELAQALRSGECDAAWAPPFICARIEAAGLKVLVRGVRDGASTYRAALVARRGPGLQSAASLIGLRAAWVDPDSVGGYLLAAALFKEQGLDFSAAFASQVFSGSYLAALTAVANEQADVTCVFAAPGAQAVDISKTGVAEIAPTLLLSWRSSASPKSRPTTASRRRTSRTRS